MTRASDVPPLIVWLSGCLVVSLVLLVVRRVMKVYGRWTLDFSFDYRTFDNLGVALQAMLQGVTMAGWADWLYEVCPCSNTAYVVAAGLTRPLA